MQYTELLCLATGSAKGDVLSKRGNKVAKAPPVGRRLQEVRKQRQMTLDQLAAASGISKSMLSQIERELANPTFATLWNIAQSLGLEISTLTGETEPDARSDQAIETMRGHFTPTLQSADGCCLLRILSPVTTASRIEWYRLEMDRAGKLESEPHAAGTLEHLTCLDGTIRVASGGAEQILAKGDTARYRGDIPHLIENTGESAAQALLVVLYSG